MSYANTLNLAADIIHTADLIARMEELQSTTDLSPDDAGDARRIRAILDELVTCGGGDEKWEGDWYPASLIADRYFTDYARELLEDCGTIPADLPTWVEIDWEATARNVRMDYTPVTVDGYTYWTR
jgi:hypothetical protein